MKKTSPLVSVIIPCYNVSGFVKRAVSSILDQSYSNLEIWVIDDGSEDDTLEKIKLFTDDRIKVVAYRENTKKIGAVNDVLQKVNGQYIAFQDADDWSEPDRIKEQIEHFFTDKELGICFTNYKCTGKKNSCSERISLTNEELKHEFLNYQYKRKAGTSPTLCATMMISKAVLDKTGGYHPYFEGRVAEDIQWIYRILKHYKGITVDKVLYNYSLGTGSFTDKQSRGVNAKYAYSWQLLSKIIYKDVHEGIDVLSAEHCDLLKKLELEACEEALSENIAQMNHLKHIYENSRSYQLGRLILTPWKLLKQNKD